MRDIEPLFRAPADPETTGFTRWDLLGLLCKHWFVVLVPFVVVTLLVVGGLLSLPPTYVTTAKVLVRTESQGRPSLLSGVTAYREPVDLEPSDRKLETEMALLVSRPIAEDTVRAFNLRLDDLYRSVLEHMMDFVADAANAVLVKWFGFPESPDTEFNGAVRALVNSITVRPAKSKSGEASPNVIDVELKAASADLAQRALRHILDRYVTFGTRLDQDAGQAALRIVETNLMENGRLVEAAESRLNAFLAKTGITLTSRPVAVPARPAHPGEEGVPVSESPSGDRAPGELATDEARDVGAGTVRRAQTLGADVADSGAPSSDSTVAALRARLLQLEFQRSEAEQVFTDRAENVRNVRALIGEVEQKLKIAIRKSADETTTLIELQRQLRTEEARHLDLKRKRDQIALFLAMNPTQTTNRVVVEVPLRPDRSDWKKKAVPGVLGAIAGLLLGLAIAGFRELGDHTLRNAADVRRYLGVESLGSQWKLERREVERALATSATAKS